ncbi:MULTISPECIES: hypothetical protein [Trichocoleus]|uniref:Uncharacterized protein n=1 Tax=Trichocoleus desertorum GB2-A4 TaxID=2933944 RepID=A0ABV0JGQ1_9CYAN|nr:hypothetical protein [Trichocoleus sp. FACHB-46]MBD1864534.1 hypothetical protein [Trichocoleus sp. FACHB-46]
MVTTDKGHDTQHDETDNFVRQHPTKKLRYKLVQFLLKETVFLENFDRSDRLNRLELLSIPCLWWCGHYYQFPSPNLGQQARDPRLTSIHAAVLLSDRLKRFSSLIGHLH